MTMLSGKIKKNNKNCQNIKTTAPLFLFPEGKIHQNLFLFSFLSVGFVDTIFKMRLNIQNIQIF